jgi:DNA repair photolyase
MTWQGGERVKKIEQLDLWSEEVDSSLPSLESTLEGASNNCEQDAANMFFSPASIMAVPLSLFAEAPRDSTGERFLRQMPDRAGRAQVTMKDKAKVLSRAQGFMGDYDFTLNPYSGCQFGCAYCYAAFFVNDEQKRQDWGGWVEVKTNAVKELERSRSICGKKVYMSSVTDPYQPLEAKVGLTREILQVLSSPLKMPRLVVQTRSPLVERDLDLLSKIEHVRINMTVTTDSELIRKKFEPLCPAIEGRLEALRAAKGAGLRTCVCITPMLPLEDPETFACRLAALKADIYVTQPFKPSNGPFAASTRGIALEIVQEFGWTTRDYERALTILRAKLPNLYEGREGFLPE